MLSGHACTCCITEAAAAGLWSGGGRGGGDLGAARGSRSKTLGLSKGMPKRVHWEQGAGDAALAGMVMWHLRDHLPDNGAEAAAVIHQEPAAIQLRYLQTMREMSAENNTTTVFPLPLDLFRPFIKMAEK